jgi:hypothetical protein
MGSSSKSGAAGSSKDVFGRAAAAVGHGPFDGITALVIDKEVVWSGHVTRAGSPGSAPISIEGWGDYTFHWGGEDQLTTSPLLTPASTETDDDHPPFHKLGYWTYVGLFGEERYSPPEIETIGYRNPDQSIITGPAAALHDFQANPFCLLAELLTSEYCGLGLPADMLVSSAWQSTAEAVMANRELYYISTSLTSTRSVKAWASELFALCDGFLRAHAQTGLVEAGLFTDPSTVNAALLPLITSQDLLTDLEQNPEDADSLKTTYILTYRDRVNNFKEMPVEYNDLSAIKFLGERRKETLTSQVIVRENQARAQNIQRSRKGSHLGATYKASVRAARARNLRPGQRVRLDIDPEPGGAQLNQVARIQSITRTVDGKASLQLDAERTLAPIPSVPEITPGTPEPPPEVPNVLYARFFEAPMGLAEKPYTIGLLASQPAPLVSDFFVHYDDNAGGTFPNIGGSRAFALRARFNAAVTSGATGPLSVELLDTLGRELIEDNPGDTAARDDTLLMVALKIAGTGQITADSGDKAWVEVLSCSEFVSTAANVIDVSVLRGRQGTPARDFALHDEVWFIRRRDLVLLEHADFEDLAGTSANAYFKIQPSTAQQERPLEDCTLRTFNFALNRDLPGGGSVTTTIEWRYKRTPFVPERPTGNNPAGWTLTNPPGADARWASFGHREIATGNILGEWSIPAREEGQIITYGATLPTSGMIEGDAFIFDDGRMYRFLSGSWGPSFAPFIKTDGDNIITGLQKANGYDNAWVMLANIFQIWNGVSSEAAFEVVSSLTFIRNALIRNAAINTAKIADLAVEMLKIGPNAVTIPLTDTRNGTTIYGSGVEVEVCSIDIYCPIEMPLLCWYSIQQGYTSTPASWGGSIRLDGAPITTRGGTATTDAPSMQKTVVVSAGWHTVSAWWYGSGSAISTNENELAIMGAAR